MSFARSRSVLAVVLLICTAGSAASQPGGKAAEADVKFLLTGVSGLGFTGLPGPVCAFGPDAFPVILVPSKSGGDLLVAAGRLGKGRVVALGHEGYFSNPALTVADTKKFLANAARWAAGKENDPAGPKIAVHQLPQLAKALTEDGITVTALPGAKWTDQLANHGVVFVKAGSVTKDEAAALRKYVESGGGVISAMPGWGWLQLNPGKTLEADLPMNQFFAAAGIAWVDGGIERPKGGPISVNGPPSSLAHSGAAIDALERWTSGGPELSNADAEVVRAAITRLNAGVPADSANPLRAKLDRSLTAAAGKMPIPTPKQPLRPKDAAGKLLLSIYSQHVMRLPPEQVKAHPAAAAFPGAVPTDAPRVSKKVKVELGVPGYQCDGVGAGGGARLWHSTGLYAAPGETIKVTLPAGAAKNLGVQIGAHTDTLWHLGSWQRVPEVVRRFPLATGETAAANPFGGLVYITFPHDAPRGTIEVSISGAVEAPLYVHGKTTPAEWTAARKHSAPWAEFVSSKLVITVPSEVARQVADPVELMKFWDSVLDGCADLTVVPRERGRAERFVHDVQISAGYLHSGYPIMAPFEEIPTVLDPVKMRREGAWGYFHELGHNHQSRDWTFDGTVEVTCNLYSLYLYETLCPKAPLHEAIRPDAITRNATKYKTGGSSFDTWKQDPFTALIMYKQFRDAFGWDAFKKAFAEYQQLPAKEKPRNDADIRDQWLVRMSNATGKNLTAAFEYWGVPVSQTAKDKLGKLPAWTPPDPTSKNGK